MAGQPPITLQAGAGQALRASGPAAGPAGAGNNREALRRAAEEYEALFLAEMLAPIFEGIETEGLFGGGSAEKIYRSLMVREYGRSLSESGGVGIADAVERELLKLQEIQQ
ncbi:MAG: rod-binding protein [Kiloniellales bacterium]|nr:rod-binding protein [Kiloniellales bacterium]